MQYKQDFYRHVYEELVVVPCFGKRLGKARLSQGGRGRRRGGGRQGLMSDSTTLSGRLGHTPWPLFSLVSAQVAISCGLSCSGTLTVNIVPL